MWRERRRQVSSAGDDRACLSRRRQDYSVGKRPRPLQFLSVMAMMRPWCHRILLGMLLFSPGVGGAVGLEAGRKFIDRLNASERAAIGLDAMTPEQMAALEAAVQRFAADLKHETVSSERQEARLALTEEMNRRDELLTQTRQELEATKSTLKARDSAAKESLLERAKVFLRPGTEVEYTNLESRLVKPFNGWRPGTLFQLESGQVWQVVEGEYWVPTQPAGKKVAVVPGKFGSFFLEIEGVRQRAKVKILSR